jgi:hypothetical protein
MTDFEKLGVFYLGRAYDLAAKQARDELILYDSRDLVTHAVCVGMTGSGKTGLCLAVLEEAAIDGIPAIVIDPKGDLADLLLTFPALQPADFRPWINEDDARKKGVSPDEFASQQAELWKSGLAKWGQDGARIQRLRDAADFSIYTPGSNAGIPVSISNPSPRQSKPCWTTASCSASGSRPPQPACSACSASTPTPSSRASTSCSPPSSGPRGRTGRTSTSPP